MARFTLVLVGALSAASCGVKELKANDGLAIAGGILNGIGQALSQNQGNNPWQPGFTQPPAFNPMVGRRYNSIPTVNPYTGRWNFHQDSAHWYQSAADPFRNTFVPGTRVQTRQTWFDKAGNRYDRNRSQWRNGVNGRPHWRDTVRRTDRNGNTNTSTGFGLTGSSKRSHRR